MLTCRTTYLLLIIPILLFVSWTPSQHSWISKKYKGYRILYTTDDKENINEYNTIVKKGIRLVKAFFNSGYKSNFDLYVHPTRHSLDSTWQNDWKMPSFKSECWMVASGTATRLDMISPKHWDKEACEHTYANTTETQQLITHELVHVYHGQQNISPDFSNADGVDWFVEGLAAYASGQCNSDKMQQVKSAIAENKLPATLDKFWTGKIRYGLSGSVVMFIDHKYGRQKLKELLPFNKLTGILASLKTSEDELLKGWKKYMQTI